MTNYQNDIYNLIPGETPKQKYEYLKNILPTGDNKVGFYVDKDKPCSGFISAMLMIASDDAWKCVRDECNQRYPVKYTDEELRKNLSGIITPYGNTVHAMNSFREADKYRTEILDKIMSLISIKTPNVIVDKWQEKHSELLQQYNDKANYEVPVAELYRSRMKDVLDFIEDLKSLQQ